MMKEQKKKKEERERKKNAVVPRPFLLFGVHEIRGRELIGHVQKQLSSAEVWLRYSWGKVRIFSCVVARWAVDRLSRCVCFWGLKIHRVTLCTLLFSSTRETAYTMLAKNTALQRLFLFSPRLVSFFFFWLLLLAPQLRFTSYLGGLLLMHICLIYICVCAWITLKVSWFIHSSPKIHITQHFVLIFPFIYPRTL